MRCSACNARYGAAGTQPAPGGTSAPDLFLPDIDTLARTVTLVGWPVPGEPVVEEVRGGEDERTGRREEAVGKEAVLCVGDGPADEHDGDADDSPDDDRLIVVPRVSEGKREKTDGHDDDQHLHMEVTFIPLGD